MPYFSKQDFKSWETSSCMGAACRSVKNSVIRLDYCRTTFGIFNRGLQNLLDFYMKVDLVEGNLNIL